STAPPARRGRAGPWLAVAGLTAAAVAAAAGVSWWLAGRPHAATVHSSRPELADGGPFVDAELHFRFDPPAEWHMQARSAGAPIAPGAERPVVKYKRLTPGAGAASLEVTLVDAAADERLTALLARRKPPEAGWTVTAKPEELVVNGAPAARIVWGGSYGPGAERDWSCEQMAIRRGRQVFVLAGTFRSG